MNDRSEPFKGRLEVCKDGEWGGVCFFGLSQEAAGVACRQLGFLSSGKNLYCDNPATVTSSN